MKGMNGGTEGIRGRFAPLLRKKDAVRLCMEVGLSEWDARTMLYGDPARGLEPMLPRVPIQRLLGIPTAANRWSRDVLLDKLSPLMNNGGTADGHCG